MAKQAKCAVMIKMRTLLWLLLRLLLLLAARNGIRWHLMLLLLLLLGRSQFPVARPVSECVGYLVWTPCWLAMLKTATTTARTTTICCWPLATVAAILGAKYGKRLINVHWNWQLWRAAATAVKGETATCCCTAAAAATAAAHSSNRQRDVRSIKCKSSSK